MEHLTKEDLQRTINSIKSFKQIIAEKGSKDEVIDYLIKETGLSKDECTLAYDFYIGIQLPE